MFIQIGKCRFRFCVAAVVGLCHGTILEDVCLSVGPEFKGPLQGNA